MENDARAHQVGCDYFQHSISIATAMLPFGWLGTAEPLPAECWHERQRARMASGLPLDVPNTYIESLGVPASMAIAGRAWHDATHLISGFGFDHVSELEVTRMQAHHYARWLYAERRAERAYIAEWVAYSLADNSQTLWHAITGDFPEDKGAYNAAMFDAIAHGIPVREPFDVLGIVAVVKDCQAIAASAVTRARADL